MTWLTVHELSKATGVDPDVIRTGIEAGLFEGWTKNDGGTVRLRSEAVEFVRWSDKLCDVMLSGVVTPSEAKHLLWCRARHARSI